MNIGTINKDAWCAGFFDGEGCVAIYKTPDRPKSWRIQLRVGQKIKAPLERLQEAYGGTIHLDNRGYWYWNLGKRSHVKEALIAMRPYFLVKGPKADDALKLLGSVDIISLDDIKSQTALEEPEGPEADFDH